MNGFTRYTLVALSTAALFTAGCKKTADNTANYKSAINTFYAAHPSCLWETPTRFPVQVATSDTDKTAPYDALVDQGLLQRTTGEKKVLIIATKQVTNYDLTDKGRSAWTADTNDPGSGNFCYGHRSVASIDSSTPNSGQPGASTQVAYHWSFSDAPDWAKAAETQKTYAGVQSNLSGNGAATATLIDTSAGWQVQPSTHPTTATQ
jgi:hypothetical protein